MSREFFDEKKAAAVLKHGILGRYLRLFSSKTGFRSKGNRVVYLDGYAGPGMYSDGEPGSPALAVDIANSLADKRDLFGIYVEEDSSTRSKLQATLANTKHKHRVLPGAIDTQWDTVMSELGPEDPLFAFFDPFGLGVSLSRLVDLMKRARYGEGFREGPATELLLNFSHPGLRRTAGHLDSHSDDQRYCKARETILVSIDATLGGEWWRPICEERQPNWVRQIADTYVKKLSDAFGGAAWYRVPVRRRLGGPTLYDLMFFTYHPDQGLWHFNECVSLASQEYYDFCTEYELDLDPESERQDRWVAEIEANIRRMLSTGPVLRVAERWGEMYGHCLGSARATHLRRAIKNLFSAGAIECDGKGELRDAIITLQRPKRHPQRRP